MKKHKKKLLEINAGAFPRGQHGHPCRYPIYPGDIFCRGCGQQIGVNGELPKPPCTHCRGRTRTMFTKFCPLCGRKLRAPRTAGKKKFTKRTS